MSKSKKIDKDHNRKGYDQWAATYDTDANSTVFADDAAFPKFWSHLKNKRVLEIGCGTGRHTQKLAALTDDITAFDMSPGMLVEARKKPNTGKVKFIESDVFKFEVTPEAAFDGIVCALVVEHIEDLPAFFSKVYSFLKPGGEAFFSEIHPNRMQAGSGARFQSGGNEIWLDSKPHTEGNFIEAINKSGLHLQGKHEILATSELVSHLPAWQKYQGKPMLQIWHLKK